jgi:hypothetical protein
LGIYRIFYPFVQFAIALAYYKSYNIYKRIGNPLRNDTTLHLTKGLFPMDDYTLNNQKSMELKEQAVDLIKQIFTIPDLGIVVSSIQKHVVEGKGTHVYVMTETTLGESAGRAAGSSIIALDPMPWMDEYKIYVDYLEDEDA